MKKLVSLLLVLVMILSLSVVPTLANTPSQFAYFEARFVEEYGEPMFYQEELIHYTVNGEMDWALIYTCTEMAIVDPLPNVDGLNYYRNCGLVFSEKDLFSPFNIGYCLYDIQKDEFFDITAVNIDQYIGLKDIVIENNLARVIGDLDFDDKVTIEDATWIQRIEAKCSIDGRPIERELSDRLHDFNNDGVANVIDATSFR